MSTTAPSYGIGEVAARFGVAVSTLRWWEKSGLLVPAGRASGRRRYDDANVRRIALIQLLQSATGMSLEEIGAVLAGSTDGRDWHDAVRARVEVCDRQLARLTAARGYLAHLLSCPGDHPSDECPYLAAELDAYLEAKATD